MGGRDSRSIVDEGVMSVGQWLAVLVTAGLNAMDGFDVLSISFASPGIAHDWGVDKATLGWVLSTELLGMALGSVVMGGVADRIGRRPTILGCVLAMAAGMFGAAQAGGVHDLLIWRLITGLGIGGVLPSINATAAEFSNRRWRSLAMALMVIGYPIGGISGGLIVQHLLATGTWHDVFVFGGWATALFLPVVWFMVPESVEFLDRKRGPAALGEINRILARFGHLPASIAGDRALAVDRRSVVDILKPGLIGTTLLITFAYFAHITSYYFILKWVPKIVVDLGFAPRAAAGVLTWLNVGGATGGAILGLIVPRLGLRRVTVCALLGASAMIVLFGRGAGSLGVLSAVVCVAGVFGNSAIAGLYLLFATVFPTHVRATGTGFAIGVGRGGGALAPVIAGYLFQSGLGLQAVATLMAVGSLASAAAVLVLRERHAH
jgi:benzoate transport